MHLLYLDDSGSVGNRDESYLVLGGISLFESQVYWLTQQLDAIAENISPGNGPSVELHASEIWAGRVAPWRGMSPPERKEVIKKVLRVVNDAHDKACCFACAVHKASYPKHDPMELAFEDLCSRFDMRLGRYYAKGDVQRGLIILDQSSYETSLQQLANDFRGLGTRWGKRILNITETPLFVNSKASRAVQLADHVAYAVFRRYHAGDTSYLDLIAGRFDEMNGVLHGLAHKDPSLPNCRCPACASRIAAEG